MSSQTHATVSVQDDHVVIENAEITDSEVVDYFSDVEEAERADALDRALRVGVATVGLAETSEQEEYVERRFEDLRHDFEAEIERLEQEVEEKFGDDGHVPQTLETHLGEDGTLQKHIDEAFGEDGVFAERLDEELGEDGERIQAALDPSRDGTPTNRLKTSLQEQIDRLRDKIEEQAATEETEERLKRKTTLKGDEFEDTVGNLLEDLVYGTSHEVEHTGEDYGELSERLVGDYVLTLDDTGQRIVIEAKSEKDYSQPDIKKELDEAIENRDADYGIIVFEAETQVPNKVGYFHEFDNDRLAVALSADEQDKELEEGYLQIAFNWARTRLVQMYVDTGSSVDPEAIQASVEEVDNEIDRFKTVKAKTTSIRNTADEIDEQLNDIKNNIVSQLSDIRREIQTETDE